jgi:hypothetical protein
MTVTSAVTVILESGQNYFQDFSIIKDCFSLVFVFSDVLLCIDLVYTVVI